MMSFDDLEVVALSRRNIPPPRRNRADHHKKYKKFAFSALAILVALSIGFMLGGKKKGSENEHDRRLLLPGSFKDKNKSGGEGSTSSTSSLYPLQQHGHGHGGPLRMGTSSSSSSKKDYLKVEETLTEREEFVRRLAFQSVQTMDGFDVVHNEDTTLPLRPISELKVVYNNPDDCPSGYTLLAQDLNVGTNGNEVYLCYKRSTSDNDASIRELYFASRWRRMPSCPSSWHTVMTTSGDKADLNYGATWWVYWRRRIVMCYRTSSVANDDNNNGDPPLYQLRVLKAKTEIPREFTKIYKNLNEYASTMVPLYMSYSNSPSMMAAGLAISEFSHPYYLLRYSHAVENSATGEITVTLNIDFRKDGGTDGLGCIRSINSVDSVAALFGGNTDLSTSEFERIKELARQGMEQYWSGPLTLFGVTRMVKVVVTDAADVVVSGETNNNNKDVNICARGEELFDGSSYYRSYDVERLDPIVPLTLWYNRGYYRSQDTLDRRFKITAAHEIGHSFLFAFGAHDDRYHKGTSTWNSETHEDISPPCPDAPALWDLNKYYIEGTCDFRRAATTNWDRAKVLMTAKTYTYE